MTPLFTRTRNAFTALALSLLIALAAPAFAYEPAAAPDEAERSDAQPHATHAGDTLPTPPAASPYTGVEATRDDIPHQPDTQQLHELFHHRNPALTPEQHAAFAEQVDLAAFAKLAVFDGGRAKIIDTLAREQITRIYGQARWRDVTTGKRYHPVFTYLDLVFNKSHYFDKPLIHIEVLPLRRQMVAHLPSDEQDQWLQWGSISPRLFMSDPVQGLLSGQGGDLRHFQAIRSVLTGAYAFNDIGARLNVISPAEGYDHWLHVLALDRLDADEAADRFASPEAASLVGEQFLELRDAWHRADAEAVNAALAGLVDQLPRINPATYPSTFQMQVEAVYNATHQFTVGFWIYLIATLALLIAFAVRQRWLANVGLGFLLVGFVIHCGAIAARIVLTQRWPIHNQYESFIAVAWFTVLLGLVLMVIRRQWLFGAAAAALGALTLLTAHSMPIPSQEAGPVAAILSTSRILYVHVNVILASYAMIALAFMISIFYLCTHYFGRNGNQPPRGGPSADTVGDGGSQPGIALASGAPSVLQFTAASVGAFDADTAPRRGRLALLNDLDKAQLIVLQLAFWTLGVGVLLGAYWADHAWGRWWAWDPKETWALITWIVYLIAIHVRFGVKNRGLVTAWLSVVGFFTMLWCYWGVNLFLAGLHSYA